MNIPMVCTHCRAWIDVGKIPFVHAGFYYHTDCAMKLGLLPSNVEKNPDKWGGHRTGLEKRGCHLHVAVDYQTERMFRTMVEDDGCSLSEFFTRLVQAENARRKGPK